MTAAVPSLHIVHVCDGDFRGSEVFFKIIFFFFGYLNPVNIFFDNKIIIFRGDLSDISAKTATLFRGFVATATNYHQDLMLGVAFVTTTGSTVDCSGIVSADV